MYLITIDTWVPIHSYQSAIRFLKLPRYHSGCRFWVSLQKAFPELSGVETILPFWSDDVIQMSFHSLFLVWFWPFKCLNGLSKNRCYCARWFSRDYSFHDFDMAAFCRREAIATFVQVPWWGLFLCICLISVWLSALKNTRWTGFENGGLTRAFKEA